jgi:hypothetical protein
MLIQIFGVFKSEKKVEPIHSASTIVREQIQYLHAYMTLKCESHI